MTVVAALIRERASSVKQLSKRLLAKAKSTSADGSSATCKLLITGMEFAEHRQF
jgi:hypothetical protein